MSGRSVKLTILFPGRHRSLKRLTSLYFVQILSPVTDNCPSWISGGRNESMWADRVSNLGPLTLESDAVFLVLISNNVKSNKCIKDNKALRVCQLKLCNPDKTMANILE